MRQRLTARPALRAEVRKGFRGEEVSKEIKLVSRPLALAEYIGFPDLNEVHDDWIRRMVLDKYFAVKAHRNGYKTSCVVTAILQIFFLYPNAATLMLRKTHTKATEITIMVRQLLETERLVYLFNHVWRRPHARGKPWTDAKFSHGMRHAPARKENSLEAAGCDTSFTGGHYDFIFADDIITEQDRYSRMERERTRRVIQELPNILVQRKNRDYGGMRFSGTPWHKEDGWLYIRDVEEFPLGTTGLDLDLAETRRNMTEELFALNYYLKVIEDRDFPFQEIEYDDPRNWHGWTFAIDPAYGGQSASASTTGVTGVKREGDTIFVVGRVFTTSITQIIAELVEWISEFEPRILYVEANADKGISAELIEQHATGFPVYPYYESKQKDERILTTIGRHWGQLRFVKDHCSSEYLSQLFDFRYGSKPNDGPDSLAAALGELPGGMAEQKSAGFGGHEIY